MTDISIFSKEKCNRYNPRPSISIITNSKTTTKKNGKDFTFLLNISRSDKCVGIFNGIGENGSDFSKTAGEFIMESFRDEWNKLKTYCIEDRNKFEQLILNIFNMTEEYLDIRYSELNDGGTRAVVLGIFRNNGETYTFTTNLGDSPCVLFNKDEDTIKHMWTDHSPDNPSEYKRYCEKVDINKRKPFIYNSVNVFDKKGEPVGPKVDYKGPLNIFDYVNNKVVVNRDNYNLLLKTDIPLGGCKSVRRHIIENDGEQSVHPDHIHENSYATIAGLTTNTRMFGCFKIKRDCYLDCRPSISVEKVTTDNYFVIGVPGFYNLWWFKDIRDLLKRDDTINSRSSCNLLYSQLIRNAQEENYKLLNKEHPCWEDITFGVIYISDNLSDDEFQNMYIQDIVNNDDTEERINIQPKINKKKIKNSVIKRNARKRRKRRRMLNNPKNRR